MDRGACQAGVHGVAQSQTQLWDRRASGENPHGRRSSRKPLRRPRPRELRALIGAEDETRIDMQYPAQYKGQELYSQQEDDQPQGWVSWAWSFVPAIVNYDDAEEDYLGNDPTSTTHLPLAPRTPPRSERSPAFQPLAGCPPPAGFPQGNWSNSPTPCHDLLFQADGTVERPLL